MHVSPVVPAGRAEVGPPGAAHEVHDGAGGGGADDVPAGGVHALREALVDVEVHLGHFVRVVLPARHLDEVGLV